MKNNAEAYNPVLKVLYQRYNFDKITEAKS